MSFVSRRFLLVGQPLGPFRAVDVLSCSFGCFGSSVGSPPGLGASVPSLGVGLGSGGLFEGLRVLLCGVLSRVTTRGLPTLSPNVSLSSFLPRHVLLPSTPWHPTHSALSARVLLWRRFLLLALFLRPRVLP